MPGVVAAGTTFDTIKMTDASGASASMTMDTNGLRFDKRYAPAWTILDCLKRQVSGDKVGFVDDTLGPAVEGSKQTS
jgi:hypothetical protein